MLLSRKSRQQSLFKVVLLSGNGNEKRYAFGRKKSESSCWESNKKTGNDALTQRQLVNAFYAPGNGFGIQA